MNTSIKIKAQIRNMPHFKAFDMMSLQYEISFCKILYDKGTITNTTVGIEFF